MPKAVEKPIEADAPQNGAPKSLSASFGTAVSQSDRIKAAEEAARHNQSVTSQLIDGNATVAMPGVRLERLADLIDHDYVAEDHTSIFADAEKYLKNPKPGAVYCFPAIEGKAANKTFAMIRRGYYRAVTQDELRDDVEAPFYTHKTPAGEFVCVYDVCFCEMTEQADKKLRQHPRQQALIRTAQAQGFKDFAGRARDLSGGAVQASMDITPDGGAAVHLEE